MGHFEDDVVHKIPHKMKTYWQNQLKISGISLINNPLLELQGESKKSITFLVIFNKKSVLYFRKVITDKFP